jgi:threonine 3-dehydrogenase
MIERSVAGEPFTIWVVPETRMPIMYITEAATATIRLAQAPLEGIKTVNYIVDGVKPTPSAAELADTVRAKIPGANIDFQSDEALKTVIAAIARPLDDTRAREEWGWQPTHTVDRIVDDFLKALQQ